MPERELKLTVAEEDLAKARQTLLAMAGRPRPSRRRLTTTYYDTPHDTLRERELMLRVRRLGRRFIQTVKSQDLAGGDLLERGEWEDRVKGAEPDLDAPMSGGHVRAVVAGDELVPLFTTAVERTSFILRPRQDTEIEVAIDRGAIETVDGASEPIHEVELELKRGDLVVLWDVALRLLEVVPFRIGTRSKGERGYALARGEMNRPPVLHAHEVKLDRKMLLDSALQAAGRRFIAVLLRNEIAATKGVAEGVHQMRVAIRRLRAVLAAMRRMLPPEHYLWANGELKWIGGALGAARNWDVFADALLEPVEGALAEEGDLDTLASAVARHRAKAYDAVRATIASQRYTASLLRLARWFEARGWRDQPVSEQSARLVAPLGKVAPRLLKRLHRKACKRSRRFSTLAPPQRHKLRIALKKLRYTVEFLETLYGKKAVARYMRRLKPLQDDLGVANDVRSAHALAATLAEDGGRVERASGVVLGWYVRALRETEGRTLGHVGRFRRATEFW
jgi:triphosphatase